MNAQSHAESFRLHIDHLRTLIERLSTALTTLDRTLVTSDDDPAYGVAALYMTSLIDLRQHIATEIARLQGYVDMLAVRGKDARAAALGS